jgi:hypothetical protein
MDSELIDQIVDRTAIADDKQFLVNELSQIIEVFNKVKTLRIKIDGAKALQDMVAASRELQSALADLSTATSQLLKKQAEESKQRKDTIKELKEEAKARKEVGAAAKDEAKGVNDAGRARKNSGKSQELNDYQQITKAYQEAAMKAKNYAVVLGETHPVTIQAIQDAKALNDYLLRIEKAVGQNGRNVGNYADGVAMGFAQISRELPSLTISVQQFALAISNNLPMLFDELSRFRREQEALAAAGQKTQSMASKVAQSLFGWQVLLSVGIALLTAYAKDLSIWAQSLFDGAGALYKVKEQQELLNAVMVEGAKSSGDEIAHLRALEIVATDTAKAQATRAKAAKELQETYPRLLASYSQEAILNGQAAVAINQVASALLNKAIAQAAENKVAELASKRLDLQLKEKKYVEELGDAKKREAKADAAQRANRNKERKEEIGLEQFYAGANRATLDKKIRDNREAQAAIAKDIDFYVNESAKRQEDVFKLDPIKKEKQKKDYLDFFEEPLQARIDFLKKMIEIEDIPFKARVAMRKTAYELEKTIIEEQYKDEVAQAEGNKIKLIKARRQYYFELAQLEEQAALDMAMIRGKAIEYQRAQEGKDNEMFLKDAEEREAKRLEAEKKAIQKRNDQTAINMRAEMNSINVRFKEGNITAKEYQEERFRIERYYSVKAMNDNISDLEKLIAYRKSKGEDTLDLERKIADEKRKIDDDLTKRLLQNREDLKKKEFEVGNLIANGVLTLISQSYERQKNAIQEQIDALDAKKQAEIDAVNASIGTEEEKAAKIANINAQAQIQKEQFAKRQRDIDVKKAQFDKAFGILKVGIDTQQAVASLTVKAAQAKAEALVMAAAGNFFGAGVATASAAAITSQIPLVLASGIIQAGLIAATPIPRYKDGRTGGDATMAIVGDGGKNEVIYSPDFRQAFLTPAHDTLTYIPRGYGVASSVAEYQELAGGMASKPLETMPILHSDNSDMIRAMAREIGGLKRAIMNKPETSINLTNGELQKVVQIGNDRIRYEQSNL